MKSILIIYFLGICVGCANNQKEVSFVDLLEKNNIVYYKNKPFNGVGYTTEEEYSEKFENRVSFKKGITHGRQQIMLNGKIAREIIWEKGRKKSGITWHRNGKIASKFEFIINSQKDTIYNKECWNKKGKKINCEEKGL